ncbi:minor capsid protein [Geminocystis sp. NIES-3709]|uniref:minor capsid protein n=1 Tax=Geminocystis sp. NIES-3709 TaxID=1617448 RepID=UPI0005FC3AEE|nr:minor capsid protein [Geminocystis sp. NIES-3709]BAQ65534.1 hypothetical protein GM3709_2299 [Geminocystis sp. NIES-3709]
MAVKDWLGITEKTLDAVDGLTDEQMDRVKKSLDRSFAQVSREMVKLYGSLDGADPDYIKVQLSKLNQLKIARQLLSPKEQKKFEQEMKDLLQLQSANGVKYADLMKEALSNPPELVQQFGNIDIGASAIAQDARQRLKKHSEDAAQKIMDAVSDNLLRGGSVDNLRKSIQGALGTTKGRAENIARTETITAFNQGARKRYEGYGAEYLQIIALVDQRTTPWCRYRHLRIIKITDSVPAYHWRCRSTVAPVDPDWIDEDDLKWMQGEMARAKDTGLNISGKAPFDDKKPNFIVPSTFKKQKVLGTSSTQAIPIEPAKNIPIKPELSESDSQDFPKDPTNLTVIRQLGGSTGAELVEDTSTGKRYVRKTGASQGHIEEEFYADQVYEALGVPVPKTRLYDKGIKLSEFIEGKPLSSFSGDELKAIHKKIQEHFAIDAILGNWDVIGVSADNIIVDNNGIPYRVDNGGALRYRAMGELKEDQWNRYPTELFTMRDANRKTGKVYGDIQITEVFSQIEHIKNNKNVFDSLPSVLRTTLVERTNEASRLGSIAKTLKADQYKNDYIDSFVKHSLGLKANGIIDKLPSSLIYTSENEIYDENRKLFDGLRDKGDDSIMGKLESYVNTIGDYSAIDDWQRTQASHSWSDGTVPLKWLMAKSRTVPQSDYYWSSYSDPKTVYDNHVSKYKNYDESMIAFQAYTYELLQNIDMPNNNRKDGTFTIYRTESDGTMERNNLDVGDKQKVIVRGAAESGSAFMPVEAVAGANLTIQKVPHHRILGTYLHSSNKNGGRMFAGNEENEFVFLPEGIPFDYVTGDVYEYENYAVKPSP